ncbi:MAG: hypothetical protein IKO44_03395 [Ruminococcus sp.]|nr:hypothetical protein [Ruminococcus sp.]
MVNKIIRRSILVCIAIISAVYYLTHYGGEYTKDNIDDYVRKMCEVYHIPGLPR